MNCPYCNKSLEKAPSRKTGCPYCHNFIYVRTDPKNKERGWVTEEQKDKIDEEWDLIAGIRETYSASQNRFNEIKERLHEQFGKEPSDNDVKWVIYNGECLEYLSKAQWGLYRNARFGMAELLRSELKLYTALELYFEVFYLDVNGACNVGLDQNGNSLSGFPPFSLDCAFVAPFITSIIKQIIKKEKITPQKSKEIFMSRISAMSNFPCPLDVNKTWELLEKHIYY